jgi:type I restriction enzyme M protein
LIDILVPIVGKNFGELSLGLGVTDAALTASSRSCLCSHEVLEVTAMVCDQKRVISQGVKANVLFFDKRPASATAHTSTLWIYDFRTNVHKTLKTNPLQRSDHDEFVTCYHADNRHDRRPTWSDERQNGRWRGYSYDELMQRDKANLDIFWLRDDSLEDSSDLPEPDEIAAEIIEDLGAALAQFELIKSDLSSTPSA